MFMRPLIGKNSKNNLWLRVLETTNMFYMLSRFTVHSVVVSTDVASGTCLTLKYPVMVVLVLFLYVRNSRMHITFPKGIERSRYK